VAKRRLFSVTTPLGDRVSLSRDRWREIIRFKHPALDGCQKLVKECLQSPSVVRESAKNADVHMYYKERDAEYLCVVTAPTNGADRFVVTAYFTANIKKGDELWRK
jgi:hypothetical protein